MPNVTIKLLSPIEDQSGAVKEVVLREPKWGDVSALGEPTSYARSESGLVYTADNDDVVTGYVTRLLVEPRDPALLNQLSLADSMQLRDAIFGFFRGARRAISAASSASSSSTSES